MSTTTAQTDGPDDRSYREIRRAIVEGRYPPGFRLVEQRLAEELEVSRTPVREALRRLEAEGLINVARNRGAEVRRYTTSEIGDLYEARARLEAYGAELAAARRTPEQLARLAGAESEFAAAVRALAAQRPAIDAVRRLADANSAFHRGVLDAASHPRLHQLVARTVDLPLVFQALRHFAADELARSALFHRLLLDAIRDQEAERAGRLMIEHVLQGRDGILSRVAEAGSTDLFAADPP